MAELTKEEKWLLGKLGKFKKRLAKDARKARTREIWQPRHDTSMQLAGVLKEAERLFDFAMAKVVRGPEYTERNFAHDCLNNTVDELLER